MSSKNFIADATHQAHGQFVKKAQAAGMSTITFARKKKNAPGVTGKQAKLAATLIGLKGKKKKPVMKAVRAPLKPTSKTNPTNPPAPVKAKSPFFTPPGMGKGY